MSSSAFETEWIALLEQAFAAAFDSAVPSEPHVMYFPVYFPEELIHAAGLLPTPFLGSASGTELRHADGAIGSFICSICKSGAEACLTEYTNPPSLFLATPICDPAKHLVSIWGRNRDSEPARILALPQNLNSPAAVDHVRAEYGEICELLEAVAGRRVTADALCQSIEIYNENRWLQRRLYAMRRDAPERIRSVELYLLLRAGTRMRREIHNDMLRRALALLEQRDVRAKDKPRVVMFGAFCEQAPLEMIEAIEDAVFIVDDDLLIGHRFLTRDVVVDDGVLIGHQCMVREQPAPADPVAVLAEAFVRTSLPVPVQHRHGTLMEDVVSRAVVDSRAAGAILVAAKFCEPGLDDQVASAKALEAASVPHLVLEFEERMTSFEQMSMQVETFAESLLFQDVYESTA